MPSSSTSTFSEPDEFEAALCRQTDVDLLVTDQGRFRARLTQVALHRTPSGGGRRDGLAYRVHIHAANLTLLWWALDRHGSQIWCGTPSLPGEMMTLGPGARAHARTRGACRWAGLWISAADLGRHWQALTGTPIIVLNGASSCRPSNAASQTLRGLHAAAITMFEHCAGDVLTESAVHGLEQQLIHALVECLSDGARRAQSKAVVKRHNSLMARFEDACVSYEHRMPSLKELCAALGVPERSLRTYCTQHLGMGPMNYLRLRRMKLIRLALRSASPADSGVAELARRHGFTEPGRFAARYRQLFGELPSATLRRSVTVL